MEIHINDQQLELLLDGITRTWQILDSIDERLERLEKVQCTDPMEKEGE